MNTSSRWHRRGRLLAVAFTCSGVLTTTPLSEARLRPSAAAFLSVAGVSALYLVATDNLRAVERNFLRRAVEGAHQHLRLAKLAVARASGSELRNLAQQFVIDQRELSQSLETLVNRKGVMLNSPPDAPVEHYGRLAEIPATEFDREFVRLVSASSDTFVRLFENAVAEARDPDIRDFAGSVLPALRFQSGELRTLRLGLD